MSVMNVNSNNVYAAYSESSAKFSAESTTVSAAKTAENKPIDDANLNADRFEKSSAAIDKATGYEKLEKLSKAQIDSLKTMQEDNLRNLVSALIGRQAGQTKKSEASLSSSFMQFEASKVELSVSGVGENELFDVDSVATRIMDMAVSLSGGDSSKLSTLRDAVKKGFEQAGQAWGDELPEICNNTYDEVMKRFDYWESNGSMQGYVYNAAATETEN